MDKQTLYADGTYDKRTVEGLLGLGDPQFISELLEIFAKTTPQYLLQLSEFYQVKNAWEMRQILHKMRGTCGTIGTKNMLNVVDALRQGLVQEDWVVVSVKLSQIHEVWAATYPYLYLIYDLD